VFGDPVGVVVLPRFCHLTLGVFLVEQDEEIDQFAADGLEVEQCRQL
jgi:hypothetical protein